MKKSDPILNIDCLSLVFSILLKCPAANLKNKNVLYMVLFQYLFRLYFERHERTTAQPLKIGEFLQYIFITVQMNFYKRGSGEWGD